MKTRQKYFKKPQTTSFSSSSLTILDFCNLLKFRWSHLVDSNEITGAAIETPTSFSNKIRLKVFRRLGIYFSFRNSYPDKQSNFKYSSSYNHAVSCGFAILCIMCFSTEITKIQGQKCGLVTSASCSLSLLNY